MIFKKVASSGVEPFFLLGIFKKPFLESANR